MIRDMDSFVGKADVLGKVVEVEWRGSPLGGVTGSLRITVASYADALLILERLSTRELPAWAGGNGKPDPVRPVDQIVQDMAEILHAKPEEKPVMAGITREVVCEMAAEPPVIPVAAVLPPELIGVNALKDVFRYAYAQGAKSADALAAACAPWKAHLPLLQRVADVRERAVRWLELTGATD